MGGLGRLLPFVYAAMVLGSLALMGVPFLSGFYSKDGILEAAVNHFYSVGRFAYTIGLLTAFLTSFYSIRLLYALFLGANRSPRTYLSHVHETPIYMALALGGLAIGSACFGYHTKDLFIGAGSSFWSNSVSDSVLATQTSLEGEFLPVIIKSIPLFGSIIATLAFVCLRQMQGPIGLWRYLSHAWYFDVTYNRFPNWLLMRTAYETVYSIIDKGVLE
jgi:NADH-ubiquinone oxidoreductase chain 5